MRHFGVTSAATASACVLALIAGSAASSAAGPPFEGPRISHPAVTPDFTLHDQNGRPVRLRSQRGKVVVLTFLYTHCPDLCPLTAVHIDQALGLLGSSRSGVIALAVSVDPHGDTPSAIRRFVVRHNLRSQFHYLTGASAVLKRIWRQYDVTSVTVGGADPDHTLYVLLLDRDGRTRVLFDATAKPATMAHDLRLLLR